MLNVCNKRPAVLASFPETGDFLSHAKQDGPVLLAHRLLTEECRKTVCAGQNLDNLHLWRVKKIEDERETGILSATHQ